MNLNGMLSGTVPKGATPGAYTLHVCVTDMIGTEACADTKLQVLPGQPTTPPAQECGLDAYAGTSWSGTFNSISVDNTKITGTFKFTLGPKDPNCKKIAVVSGELSGGKLPQMVLNSKLNSGKVGSTNFLHCINVPTCSMPIMELEYTATPGSLNSVRLMFDVTSGSITPNEMKGGDNSIFIFFVGDDSLTSGGGSWTAHPD